MIGIRTNHLNLPQIQNNVVIGKLIKLKVSPRILLQSQPQLSNFLNFAKKSSKALPKESKISFLHNKQQLYPGYNRHEYPKPHLSVKKSTFSEKYLQIVKQNQNNQNSKMKMNQEIFSVPRINIIPPDIVNKQIQSQTQQSNQYTKIPFEYEIQKKQQIQIGRSINTPFHITSLFSKTPENISKQTPNTYQFPHAMSGKTQEINESLFQLIFSQKDNKIIISFIAEYLQSTDFQTYTIPILNRLKYKFRNKQLQILSFYKYLSHANSDSLQDYLLINNVSYSKPQQIDEVINYFFSQLRFQQAFETAFFSFINMEKSKQLILDIQDKNLKLLKKSNQNENKVQFWQWIKSIEQKEIFDVVQQWLHRLIQL